MKLTIIKPIITIGILFLVYIVCDSVITWLRDSSYFTVSSVNIKGILNSNIKDKEKIIADIAGKNIFDIKLDKNMVFEDQWIKKVELQKVYPNTVEILIYEKIPVFKMEYGGACYQFTYDGDKIRTDCKDIKVYSSSKINEQFLNNFAEIYKILAFDDIKKINLNRSFFEIISGDFRLVGCYERDTFKQNYNIFKNSLVKLYKNIEYADLRVADKIYINGLLYEKG